MLPSPPLSPCESCDSQPEATASKYRMETFSQGEPIPLQPRFAEIKKKIISDNADAIAASWKRLLAGLKAEIDSLSGMDTADIIPTIDFEDIGEPAARIRREEFASRLRHRGVGVIRSVVSREVALTWKQDLDDYLWTNPQTRISNEDDKHHTYELFWSPTQIQARAHPDVLAAQKFAMSHWHMPSPRSPSSTKTRVPLVSTNSPLTYADRIVVPFRSPAAEDAATACAAAQVDNGSVERWEADGYGRARTYSYIFEGWWEGHDPWGASARVLASPDLYGGAGRCSAFRMFQGWLSLGGSEHEEFYLEHDAHNVIEGTKSSGLAVVPLLKHATAYFLLRPFFSPRITMDKASLRTEAEWDAFLSEENWTLIPPAQQNTVLHGALPSYAQEINDLLHPHLRLRDSLVLVPPLEPGDYLIWHPDLIHTSIPGDGATMLCLPSCPLTQSNALYLAQQRKAFLLGNPGPDFARGAGSSQGESFHVGRPGVQDVSDAGGEDGLRAMGLYPWDEEEESGTEMDGDVREMANKILFPDGFGMA